MPTSQQFKCW